jgi:hypothetical protein
MSSKLERWDRFAWTQTPVPRKYKVTQHVQGGLVSPQVLLSFRVFAMTGMWMQMTFSWYWDADQMHESELQYFTEWGKYMTLFTFTLLVFGHIWFKDGVNPESIQLMEWWKWCSWIYPMCLWWETIITIVFWSFLLPTTNFGDVFAGHPWGEFKLMTDHIFPLFFLLCDWALNAFYFET